MVLAFCETSSVMGQPGPVVIALRREKNLRLILQPPESLAVKDPVPVPLKHGRISQGSSSRSLPREFCSASHKDSDTLLPTFPDFPESLSYAVLPQPPSESHGRFKVKKGKALCFLSGHLKGSAKSRKLRLPKPAILLFCVFSQNPFFFFPFFACPQASGREGAADAAPSRLLCTFLCRGNAVPLACLTPRDCGSFCLPYAAGLRFLLPAAWLPQSSSNSFSFCLASRLRLVGTWICTVTYSSP